MVKRVALAELIDRAHLPRISLTSMNGPGSSRQVPLFGHFTQCVIDRYYAYLEHIFNRAERTPPTREEAAIFFDHMVRLGALAASLKGDGKLVDICCGVAIPSIVFSLLTGRKSVAVDIEATYIEHVRAICSLLGLRTVHTIQTDCTDMPSSITFNAGDTLFLSNPLPHELIPVWFKRACELRLSFILTSHHSVFDFALFGSQPFFSHRRPSNIIVGWFDRTIDHSTYPELVWTDDLRHGALTIIGQNA